LADAQDSGSCVRKDVGVQVPPRPPTGEQDLLSVANRTAASKAVDTTGERFVMVIDHHSYAKRAEAATALQAVTLNEAKRIPVGERRAVAIGKLAGFTVVATVSKDSTETSVNFGLDGVPRYTPTVTRDELRSSAPLGILTRLENLSGDLPARADTAATKAQDLRAEAAKAAGRIGQPFEHSGRITSLRARLTAIDLELAPPEPEPPATQPEPEPVAARGPSGPRPTPGEPAPNGAVQVSGQALARARAQRTAQQHPRTDYGR